MRLEAADKRKDVLSQQTGYLKGIGEPPAPIETVPRETLTNPDSCAQARRSWTKELMLLRMKRRHPDWVPHVDDDAGNSIDAVLKLNTPNARTLAGWGFALSQLTNVCYTNGPTVYPKPIPQIVLIDWRGVSDSA
jgi:hypothetical protein